MGAALHAFRRAPDRLWACAAMVASGLELVVWCIVVASLVVPLVGNIM